MIKIYWVFLWLVDLIYDLCKMGVLEQMVDDKLGEKKIP